MPTLTSESSRKLLPPSCNRWSSNITRTAWAINITPREAVAIPVVVQQVDSSLEPLDQPFNAVTRDISTGGIGLFHLREMKSGLLKITMTAPRVARSHDAVGSCRALHEVRWVLHYRLPLFTHPG